MGEFRRQYHVETSELDDSLAVRHRVPGALRAPGRGRPAPVRGSVQAVPEPEHDPRHRRLPVPAQQAGGADQDRVDTHQRVAGRHRLQPGPLHPAGGPTARTTQRSATSAPTCARAPTTRCPATTPSSTPSRSSCRSSRIIERFRGREGQTEADRAWTRRVTDVRNWFVFSASERWREDNTEHEHYADSGGKSGGQKEKLAYTILAASLAYQFRLERGPRAPDASGSSSSTRRSAAGRTSPPGSRSNCSGGSACNC